MPARVMVPCEERELAPRPLLTDHACACAPPHHAPTQEEIYCSAYSAAAYLDSIGYDRSKKVGMHKAFEGPWHKSGRATGPTHTQPSPAPPSARATHTSHIAATVPPRCALPRCRTTTHCGARTGARGAGTACDTGNTLALRHGDW